MPSSTLPVRENDELLYAREKSLYSSATPGANEFQGQQHILAPLKPLWVVLRFLGYFPVHNVQGGRGFEFKLLSPSMCYSVFCYLTCNVYSYFVTQHRFNMLLQHLDGNFNDSIFHYMCLLYCLPPWSMRVLHWMQAGAVAKYINQWHSLQSSYFEVTSTLYPYNHGQRRQVFLFVLLIPVSTLALVAICFILLDSFLVWETFLFVYTVTIVKYHCAMWFWVCQSLGDVATCIADSLEVELCATDHYQLSQKVRRYCSLWRDLSRLVCSTGHVLYYMFGFVLVLWFTILVLTTYGAISNDIVHLLEPSSIALSLASVHEFAIIWTLLNSAQHATNRVGPKFLDRLSTLVTTDTSTANELIEFQRAVTVHQPVMNLGDYVTVNRALIISLMSSMVTYLVVLLQFKMNDTIFPATAQGNDTSLI